VYRLGGEAPGLKDVVLEVATRARDHLGMGRAYIEENRGMDREILEFAFPAFLTGVSVLQTDFFILMSFLVFVFNSISSLNSRSSSPISSPVFPLQLPSSLPSLTT